MVSTPPAMGQVVGGRYRLERPLGGASGPQGDLWLARDTLAADAPAALRRLGPDQDQRRARQLWARLQGVLHPQVPRVGAAISEGDQLWLVREWQAGRTYQQLLAARQERQLVFGAGEVLLLLRQLLPVLVALHGQDLLHGDITPANVLRRDSDGLPVLLDFGLLQGPEGGAVGATPGYAPPERFGGEPPQPWMDLHALGVMALVLLSGDGPERLLQPQTMEWLWPAGLDGDPALRQQLGRLLSRDPGQRFETAAQALAAVQALTMPDSTGPVPRADRTVVLVPTAPPPGPPPVPPEPPAAAAEPTATPCPPPQGEGVAEETTPPPVPAAPAAAEPARAVKPPPATLPPTPARGTASPVRARQLEREEQAEGGLWPVLLALVVSAVAGTAIGWWWLGRGGTPAPPTGVAPTLEEAPSLPPGEVDQREQLISRLRALQVDRGWFLELVNASLLAQYPERRGRLPSDSLEDAPLRKAWNDLAEDWLARVEQLPMALRRRLGSFSATDWEQRQRSLAQQGLSAEVLEQLVSGSAQTLLPTRSSGGIPAEPYRQLWYAAAVQILENLSIEPIDARPRVTQLLAADVPANGARLFPIRLPPGHALVLGVNGTPLLQMSVYAADGRPLAPRGPLRVVNLGVLQSSPVQLLVTNEGVAPSRISLSLRADPPPPPPAVETAPASPEASASPPEGAPATPGAEEPAGTPAPGSAPAPSTPSGASPPVPPSVPAPAAPTPPGEGTSNP
ncbi:MAG: serine/threonine protein kinase [Cyanobacteriota bacterium]|nr:serine/threonine protein kinase [Cyanobacteriota bacterium]